MPVFPRATSVVTERAKQGEFGTVDELDGSEVRKVSITPRR